MTDQCDSHPQFDQQHAIDLVTELMGIPGKSGEEMGIANAITSKLLSAGIPESAIQFDSAHQRSPAGGGTGNLIVKLPGTTRGPRRLLMAHMDTVPLCQGCEPIRQGNFIVSKNPATALGGDDRAGVSVVLNSILEIQKQQLPYPPLTLFFPIQEEIGLCGARYVTKGMLGNPKLCFNWDGTYPNAITLGATGDYAMRITLEGLASHAGVAPQDGISAIAIASLAIADLQENGWHGLIQKGKKSGTSNVGIIQGGDATNVVTPKVFLKAEARSHDPEFRKKIVKAFETAFNKAVRSVKNAQGKKGSVHFEAELKYESFVLDRETPAVKVAVAAIEALGLEAEYRISNGGLDANWMTAHGFPTITMGCGQDGIHTVKERLNIDQYLKACAVGLQIATGHA